MSSTMAKVLLSYEDTCTKVGARSLVRSERSADNREVLSSNLSGPIYRQVNKRSIFIMHDVLFLSK